MSVTIQSTTATPLTGKGTVSDASLTVTCTITGPITDSKAATMNGAGWDVDFGTVQAGCYVLVAQASDTSTDSRQISVGGIPC